jgi:hypothetical protein
MDEALISLAKQTADSHQLFGYVVCGICERESSWNPWLIRYEPSFEANYVSPLIVKGEVTDATEVKGRSISWGLMQTIGESVRELGYRLPFPQLCDPATGLEWGCRLFTLKLRHAAGNVENALQLWNGGGNPNYGSEVLTLAEKYR